MNTNLHNAMILCQHGIAYRHEGGKLMAREAGSGQWVDVSDYSEPRLMRFVGMGG